MGEKDLIEKRKEKKKKNDRNDERMTEGKIKKKCIEKTVATDKKKSKNARNERRRLSQGGYEKTGWEQRTINKG